MPSEALIRDILFEATFLDKVNRSASSIESMQRYHRWMLLLAIAVVLLSFVMRVRPFAWLQSLTRRFDPMTSKVHGGRRYLHSGELSEVRRVPPASRRAAVPPSHSRGSD